MLNGNNRLVFVRVFMRMPMVMLMGMVVRVFVRMSATACQAHSVYSLKMILRFLVRNDVNDTHFGSAVGNQPIAAAIRARVAVLL